MSAGNGAEAELLLPPPSAPVFCCWLSPEGWPSCVLLQTLSWPRCIVCQMYCMYSISLLVGLSDFFCFFFKRGRGLGRGAGSERGDVTGIWSSDRRRGVQLYTLHPCFCCWFFILTFLDYSYPGNMLCIFDIVNTWLRMRNTSLPSDHNTSSRSRFWSTAKHPVIHFHTM